MRAFSSGFPGRHKSISAVPVETTREVKRKSSEKSLRILQSFSEPAMDNHSQHLYEFGLFRLDPVERLLLRNGERVPLTPKVFETLVALIEHRGHLIEKEKLIKLVWPDSFVEEANLTNNVSTLRKALGEGESGATYIETIPRVGYRFTAQVREVPRLVTALVVERHSLTRIETEETEEETGNEVVQARASEHKETVARWATFSFGAKPWSRWKAPVAVGAFCLVIAAGALTFSRSWSARDSAKSATPPENAAQLRSIAVLPFRTSGDDAENEYLSMGMNEALIARLNSLPQLIVRPPSAVRRYTDAQDAVSAGREQGVDSVLDGSVQRSGDRIRITVQLQRVRDRAVIWSGQFDERLNDIFAVQDSISRQVAQGLMVKLTDQEQQRLQKGPQKNFEAYQAYLKGRYFWNKRTAEGIRKSLDYFNRAIELDPAYATAYAGLADSYLLVGAYSPPTETIPKAKAAAGRAIELDETLAEPHATLGLIAENYDWDWAEVERQYRRAIELNPNYATAHHWYGEFLAFMGRYDEGLAEIKRAQELDPLSLAISTDVGKIHYIAREYDRAIEECKKTLEMDGGHDPARLWLSVAYLENGQYEAAVAELRKIKNWEDDPTALAFLGYVHGRAGRKSEAREVLGRLIALSRRAYVSPTLMAFIKIAIGEKDGAFRSLEEVFKERAIGVVALKVDPVFDSLRSDPRFELLLRRAGFVQ